MAEHWGSFIGNSASVDDFDIIEGEVVRTHLVIESGTQKGPYFEESEIFQMDSSLSLSDDEQCFDDGESWWREQECEHDLH